jgi:ribonuclease HII
VKQAELGIVVELAGRLAGVDEAGRGPLAGSVFAAAVILNPECPVTGLKDSKQLSPVRREQLAELLREHCLAWAVASADCMEIDRINILQATLIAMQRAVASLSVQPDGVLIDGNQVPRNLGLPARAIVKGDQTVAAISAASILAKCARDAEAMQLASQYPGYGFERHKGYGTAEHMEGLRRLGPCPAHRRSFAPVNEACRLHGVS